jgi:hypothetical protein
MRKFDKFDKFDSTADLTNCNLDGANYEAAILHNRTTCKIFNWFFSNVTPVTPIQIVDAFDKNNVLSASST